MVAGKGGWIHRGRGRRIPDHEEAFMGIRLSSVCLGVCLIPLSTIADGYSLPTNLLRYSAPSGSVRSSIPPNSIRFAQYTRRNSERDRDRDQRERLRDQRERDRDQRDQRERDREQQEKQDDRWNCRSITIAEFKSWIVGFDEALEGGLPSRRQWARLKALAADIEEENGTARRKCKTE